MSEQPVLSVEGLAKDYGDGFGLNRLDLSIDRGELVLLVGHNGSGKSTLLGLVSGFLEPTEGSVSILGSPADSVEARTARSYVPDEPILYSDLTMWEHIAYNAALHGTPDWEGAAEDLLVTFQLMDRTDDLPARFSRGMRQKAATIVGLVRPFDLLLMDEPFLGLDVAGQDALVTILGDLAGAGRSVVVSTHQPNLTAVATRCVGLRDGDMVYDGDPDPDVIGRIIHG
jgi:ABC-type multidrug transport system ATPase subunit